MALNWIKACYFYHIQIEEWKSFLKWILYRWLSVKLLSQQRYHSLAPSHRYGLLRQYHSSPNPYIPTAGIRTAPVADNRLQIPVAGPAVAAAGLAPS